MPSDQDPALMSVWSVRKTGQTDAPRFLGDGRKAHTRVIHEYVDTAPDGERLCDYRVDLREGLRHVELYGMQMRAVEGGRGRAGAGIGDAVSVCATVRHIVESECAHKLRRRPRRRQNVVPPCEGISRQRQAEPRRRT